MRPVKLVSYGHQRALARVAKSLRSLEANRKALDPDADSPVMPSMMMPPMMMAMVMEIVMMAIVLIATPIPALAALVEGVANLGSESLRCWR